jgi:hypothetical protein
MTHRPALFSAIQDAADFLEARGVDVSPIYKRRDPREPGRRQKEAAEDRLRALVMAHFRRQKRHIRRQLESMFPDRKQMGDPLEEVLLGFEDPKFSAQMQKFFTSQAVAGVQLMAEDFPEMDIADALEEATRWAKTRAGEFIGGIDETTLSRVRNLVTDFIETPGFTIGDVISGLPFTEERGLLIAVTEITDSFAAGALFAGEQLQKQVPDVAVLKQWFTNNDDLVCAICGPIHEDIKPLNKQFEGGYDRPPAHPGCRCWMTTFSDILGESVITEGEQEFVLQSEDSRYGLRFGNIVNGEQINMPNIQEVEEIKRAYSEALDTYERFGIDIKRDLWVISDPDNLNYGLHLGGERREIIINMAQREAASALFAENLSDIRAGKIPMFTFTSDKDVLTHELGHAVYSNLTDKQTQEYFYFFENHSPQYNDVIPSFYAQDSHLEMWAESVTRIVGGNDFDGAIRDKTLEFLNTQRTN